jgi:acylphosphatase
MVVRRRVIISGDVQGVFFRDSCRRLAVEHSVAGWIRNRPDGRVEAAFEGESDAVDRLIDWCRSGPPHASVDDVETTDEEPTGETTFQIL